MTPHALVKTLCDLQIALHSAPSPADRVIAGFLRDRRFIGGGDRRRLLECNYGMMRVQARLQWWVERFWPQGVDGLPIETQIRLRLIAFLLLVNQKNAAETDALCDGSRHALTPMTLVERAFAKALEGQELNHPEQPHSVRFEYPAWLAEPLARAFPHGLDQELLAFLMPAPTDLRANTLKTSRERLKADLAKMGIGSQFTPFSPWGLRLERRLPFGDFDLFRDGHFEVQDEGSQLVALLVAAQPGFRVVDYCAGAGGKSLALAAVMNNKGHIVAGDTSAARLKRAITRIRRAGVHNIEYQVLKTEHDPWVKRHKSRYDRVLVDAPCSGTGTWRRNPDARWHLSQDRLAELQNQQFAILQSAGRLVKPGGWLIYATCSILYEENEDQVVRFLRVTPHFRPMEVHRVWEELLDTTYPAGNPYSSGPYLRLSPGQHNTDGFFLAIMERKATE